MDNSMTLREEQAKLLTEAYRTAKQAHSLESPLCMKPGDCTAKNLVASVINIAADFADVPKEELVAEFIANRAVKDPDFDMDDMADRIEELNDEIDTYGIPSR